MRIRSSRTAVPVLLASVAVAALTGCSSNSSTPSASSATPATSSASPSGSATTGAECNTTAISAALPSGSTVSVFKCATAGNEFWAAGTVTDSSGARSAFFLKDNQGTWTVVDKNSICGTASAGLPASILAFCTS